MFFVVPGLGNGTITVGLACATVCGAIAFGGCAEPYKPDAEHYFEINGVFNEMVVEVDTAFVKGSMNILQSYT